MKVAIVVRLLLQFVNNESQFISADRKGTPKALVSTVNSGDRDWFWIGSQASLTMHTSRSFNTWLTQEHQWASWLVTALPEEESLGPSCV